MGLRETLTLKETLEAATPGPWEFSDSTDPRGHKGEFRAPSPHNGFMLVGPWTNDADPALIALAPELAALVLDMGEELRRSLPQDESMDHGRDPDRRALLARLDRLGKEPGDE